MEVHVKRHAEGVNRATEGIKAHCIRESAHYEGVRGD